MNKNIIIGIIVILAIGGVLFFVLSGQKSASPQNSTQDQLTNSGTDRMIAGYQGKVLAGNASPFLEFNKADYEKAKSDGKIIVLDFYATWCPICRAEAPEIHAGFDALTSDHVVGFRVNFNDPDTDADEKALATEFSIPYQHTKVILKDGQEVSRSMEQWTKDDFLQNVNSALQ